MNFRKLGKILGKIMILEGVLMLAPLAVSLIYNEGIRNVLAFIVPIILLTSIGLLLQMSKPGRQNLYQKEGFALVAIVWIVMALFGAIPFVINKDIPNYIDACFEIISGFSTTGASVINDISVISRSTLFWRSFSHWIGGMGILVFVLIFIPESNEGSSMHLLRAESPGPQVGKIVSKMKVTARILYLIYLALTLLEVIMLMFDKPIAGYEGEKFFFSLLTAFGCAGTGGFGFITGSMQLFNPFSQYVMATFMFLFGINFSLYYLLLIGKVKDVVRSGELKTYIIIFALAVLTVFIGLYSNMNSLGYSGEQAFRHSYFQIASLMTTTGYTTTDYNMWPTLCKTILVIVMFGGGMAGSTSGGVKISRLAISFKGAIIRVRKLINPRYVPKVKFEGKTLEENTINDVFAYLVIWMFLFVLATLLLSFDPINGQTVTIVSDFGSYQITHGLSSNLSAVYACISNVGPAFDAVGPYASYFGYSPVSKIVLSIMMLIGRLEILPVLILFNSRTWKRV